MIGLLVSVTAIIAASLAISFASHDPHWLNRGEALIAARSAGAIFFQTRSEISIEKKRQELESALPKASEPLPLNPVAHKAIELKKKKLETRGLGLTRERLQMAIDKVLLRAEAIFSRDERAFFSTSSSSRQATCSSPVTIGEA